MPYTRLYPILNNTSYRPSDNPLRKQIRVTVTDASDDITNVRADYAALVTTPSNWFVNITLGTNNNLVGSYQIVSVPTATSLQLRDMTLAALNPPAGSTGSDYTIALYESYRPTELDGFAEAFVLNALPTTGGATLDIITRAGQYVQIPASTLIVGAIYNIAIAKIVASNGATGFLLGAEGINGSGII